MATPAGDATQGAAAANPFAWPSRTRAPHKTRTASALPLFPLPQPTRPHAEVLEVAATMLDVSEPLFTEVKRLVKGVEVRGQAAQPVVAPARSTQTRQRPPRARPPARAATPGCVP